MNVTLEHVHWAYDIGFLLGVILVVDPDRDIVVCVCKSKVELDNLIILHGILVLSNFLLIVPIVLPVFAVHL